MFLEKIHSKLPANFISNREFCISIEPNFRPEGFTPETADEWIFERSGIRMRPVFEPSLFGKQAPSLEKEVTEATVCASTYLHPNQAIDAIIAVRSSPSHFVPGLSQRILRNLVSQKRIANSSAFTLDLHQPSTGALTAMSIARHLPFERILVVISEFLTPLLNLKDPGTAMLFGDAVTSFVLTKTKQKESQFEVLGELIYSMPDDHGVLENNYDPTSFKMKGPELFRKIVPEFKKSSELMMKKLGLSVDQIQHYLPHQANRRILERAAHGIGFLDHQIITNIERVGNLSSASMPVALTEALQLGRIQSGDLILMNACGAGLTSGAAVIKAI